MANDGVKFLLSACGCPVFPAALTEEDALSPMYSLLKNKPTNLCKRKQLGFYSVPLVLYGISYYSFLVSWLLWILSVPCSLLLQLFAFSRCLAFCSQYLLPTHSTQAASFY